MILMTTETFEVFVMSPAKLWIFKLYVYIYFSRSPELSSYNIASELIIIKTHVILAFLTNQLTSTVIVSIFSVDTLLNWSIHILDELYQNGLVHGIHWAVIISELNTLISCIIMISWFITFRHHCVCTTQAFTWRSLFCLSTWN